MGAGVEGLGFTRGGGVRVAGTDVGGGGRYSGERVWKRARAISENIRFFFFQAEDGIRDLTVTGVQTCALPISRLAFFQMIGGKTLGGLNGAFLTTTILTSVTGFFFPITKVTPGLVIGGISLLEIGRASCRERV